MLRALQRFLGTGVPVIGVNFGRVGFLSSIPRDELERGIARVLGGELEIVELATLDVEAAGSRFVAVNDAVVTSGELGRMVELEWSFGGENFGRVPCDGLICSTPSGSTAYNLSNGGPVLMWGLDAMALTFVAPHDLRARPFVVPRGHDLHVWNRTPDVGCAVLVDGHRVADAGSGAARLDQARRRALLLGTCPTRRSCGATARASASAEPPVGSGRLWRPAPPVYDLHDAATPANRESRPHSGGRARAGAGPERVERGNRGRENDLRPGDRPSPRGQGGRRSGRPGGDRGICRGRARRAGRVLRRRGAPTLAELRPEDEPGLVLARRVFADGRTRAYAWGRAVAREDLAAATERLIAMSGQFEQRRLARPAYQLDVLDAFIGEPQAARRQQARDAWRQLDVARRRAEEIARDAGAEAPGSKRCASSSIAPTTSSAGKRRGLRAERTACATLPS